MRMLLLSVAALLFSLGVVAISGAIAGLSRPASGVSAVRHVGDLDEYLPPTLAAAERRCGHNFWWAPGLQHYVCGPTPCEGSPLPETTTSTTTSTVFRCNTRTEQWEVDP
jgi:hypothetical protein